MKTYILIYTYGDQDNLRDLEQKHGDKIKITYSYDGYYMNCEGDLWEADIIKLEYDKLLKDFVEDWLYDNDIYSFDTLKDAKSELATQEEIDECLNEEDEDEDYE